MQKWKAAQILFIFEGRRRALCFVHLSWHELSTYLEILTMRLRENRIRSVVSTTIVQE